MFFLCRERCARCEATRETFNPRLWGFPPILLRFQLPFLLLGITAEIDARAHDAFLRQQPCDATGRTFKPRLGGILPILLRSELSFLLLVHSAGIDVRAHDAVLCQQPWGPKAPSQ